MLPSDSKRERGDLAVVGAVCIRRKRHQRERLAVVAGQPLERTKHLPGRDGSERYPRAPSAGLEPTSLCLVARVGPEKDQLITAGRDRECRSARELKLRP